MTFILWFSLRYRLSTHCVDDDVDDDDDNNDDDDNLVIIGIFPVKLAVVFLADCRVPISFTYHLCDVHLGHRCLHGQWSVTSQCTDSLHCHPGWVAAWLDNWLSG